MIQNFHGSVFGTEWLPSTDANHLVTGCQDGSITKWQVIEEEEGQHVVSPCWVATNGSLSVTGASIQDVRGLSPSNLELLRQQGAVKEPEDSSSPSDEQDVDHDDACGTSDKDASEQNGTESPPRSPAIPDGQAQQQVEEEDDW